MVRRPSSRGVSIYSLSVGTIDEQNFIDNSEVVTGQHGTVIRRLPSLV